MNINSLRFAYPHQPISHQQLLRSMPTVVFFRRVSALPRISPLFLLPSASLYILLVGAAGEGRRGRGGRESGGRQEGLSGEDDLSDDLNNDDAPDDDDDVDRNDDDHNRDDDDDDVDDDDDEGGGAGPRCVSPSAPSSLCESFGTLFLV